MNKATLKSHATVTKASLHRKAHNGTRRKAANSIYSAANTAESFLNEGMKVIAGAQDSLNLYKRDLNLTVQRHPIPSVLIAGGIGYILCALFRK
jgi:hypothetical protein